MTELQEMPVTRNPSSGTPILAGKGIRRSFQVPIVDEEATYRHVV